MTRQWFNEEMSRLAGLKFVPRELETHWEALSDIAADFLKTAIDRAQRECEDFPAPKTLRQFADQANRSTPQPVLPDRSKPLDQPYSVKVATIEVRVDRMWSYYCETCSDSGVRTFACGESALKRQPWLTPAPCGRTHQEGYGHDWAEVCACAETNPAVRAKRDRAMRSERRDAAA